MTNLCLSGRTAVLSAAISAMAIAGGCDVPGQAIAAVAVDTVGTSLISGAITTVQASLAGRVTSLAPAPGDAPPELADPPAPQTAPDPNDVYIEDIEAIGAGCPNDSSYEYLISDDKTSFIIMFKDMLLENPPGPAVKTTNCQAAVKLHVPGGWQVSLATVNTRGYAYLEHKLRARQTSAYIFAGVPLGAKVHTELKGPFDDYYDYTDVIPLESVVWSPCGESAIFGINTTLNLNAAANKKGQGIFNTTDVDGQFRKIVHWQWKKC